MPLTPERVWRAIQDAQRTAGRGQPGQEGQRVVAPRGQAEPESRSYPEPGEQGIAIQEERPAPPENEPFEGQGLIEDLRDEGKAPGESEVERRGYTQGTRPERDDKGV